MATLTGALPNSPRQPPWPFWKWFREFLTEELRPYPGRAALVARMMIAATLVMIVTMTFRIPDGAYAGIYALTLSRESARATLSDLKAVVIAFVIAAAYQLTGAVFFVNEPLLRFVWLIATFFLMFYCLSALTNYTAGVRFGYLVIVTTPLWDLHVPAEMKVENTLWAVWSITVASILTAVIELIYTELTRGNDLVFSLDHRLARIQEVLLTYGEGRPVDEGASREITRLAVVGMSRLRRTLYRSAYSSQYREQMGAAIALVSRLLDLAANLMELKIHIPDADRKRISDLAGQIAGIRTDLARGAAPQRVPRDDPPSAIPFLREMETTVCLIPEAFTDSQSLSAYAPLESVDAPPAAIFRADALSNLDHVKFGLKGCLAAALCYIIYNLVDWTGLSTAIATCFLTAQTTIGSSRQKQLLRVAGALVGGVLLGMGAQVFILPHLDSIADFTVLFLAVTFIACWFATSSARLSYFGVQVAVAFYLINLQEFKLQTSLSVARDRVAGIFLGLLMMWLVFDQLWGTPAAVEMRRAFASNLRLLAQFTREPVSPDLRTAVDRSFEIREMLNTGFDKVRGLADGVVLEFGQSRQRDLALRSRIRQWQATIHVIFITRTTLWKYRMRLPGFDLPETVRIDQREYDQRSAQVLEQIADLIDGKPSDVEAAAAGSPQLLQRMLLACRSEEATFLPPAGIESFAALLRANDNLTTSLIREVSSV
jgi:multidrug resistance protein MdtO